MMPTEMQVLERVAKRATIFVVLVAGSIGLAATLHTLATANINRRFDSFEHRLAERDTLEAEFRYRLLVVAELAVVAIADEDEARRQRAVAELREMRRVLPRTRVKEGR